MYSYFFDYYNKIVPTELPPPIITAIDKDHINITFIQPIDNKIERYYIYVSNNNNNVRDDVYNVTSSELADSSSYIYNIIHNIDDNTYISFTIKAENQIGSSNYSLPSNSIYVSKPFPIVITDNYTLSSYDIYIEWINNIIDNDIYNPILYYKITFNNTIKYTVKDSKSIIITNYNMIQPLCYNIEIIAVNVFGNSETTSTVMCSLDIPFNVVIDYIINNKYGYLIRWNISDGFEYEYNIEIVYENETLYQQYNNNILTNQMEVQIPSSNNNNNMTLKCHIKSKYTSNNNKYYSSYSEWSNIIDIIDGIYIHIIIII